MDEKREKVISNLQGVYEYLRHFENTANMGEWVADALAMMKEQEAVEPILEKLKFSETWVCGNCRNELFEGAVIRDNYCSNCGRPVLWEGR